MDGIKELLEKIATPGDAAALALGFVLGAPVDYFLLHMGVPVGSVSPYTIASVFFLKKSFDIAYKNHLDRKKLKNARPALKAKGKKLLSILEQEKQRYLPEFRRQLEFWEQGVITNEDFEQIIADTAKKPAEIPLLTYGSAAPRESEPEKK
jgi:hypothetical protein